MTAPIIIALISSITSVIVALVSLYNSRLNNRNTQKANQDLEDFKFQLENKRKVAAVLFENYSKRILAIERHLKAIQEVKDRILLIQSSIPNSLACNICIEYITIARENLFGAFENESHNLTAEEIGYAHKAKNITLIIENKLKSFLHNSDFVSLDSAQQNEISNLKNILSDCQNALRDSNFKLSLNISTHGSQNIDS